MGYIITDFGDFEGRFHFGNHERDCIPTNLFTGIDALVKEGSLAQFYVYKNSKRERDLVSISEKGDLPHLMDARKSGVFIIDAPYTLTEDSFSPPLGFVPEKTFLEAIELARRYASSSDEIPLQAIDSLCAYSLKFQRPFEAGRSALVAYKFQNWLLPKLKRELNGKKPVVGFVYGIAHADLMGCLSDPAISNQILKNMLQANVPLFLKEGLLDALVLKFDGNRSKWNVERETLPVDLSHLKK